MLFRSSFSQVRQGAEAAQGRVGKRKAGRLLRVEMCIRDRFYTDIKFDYIEPNPADATFNSLLKKAQDLSFYLSLIHISVPPHPARLVKGTHLGVPQRGMGGLAIIAGGRKNGITADHKLGLRVLYKSLLISLVHHGYDLFFYLFLF